MSLGNILNEFQGEFGKGDNLSLNSPYEWEITANPNFIFLQNNNKLFIKNGNSLGFDYRVKNSFVFKSKKKLSYDFKIENFGLMYLHSNVEKYTMDTSFNFTGLEFDEIFNFDSTLIDYKNQINSNKITKEKEVLISPFVLHGNLIYKINNSTFTAGVFYRHNSQYIPKSYFLIQKKK
jgi:hypothetical protein